MYNDTDEAADELTSQNAFEPSRPPYKVEEFEVGLLIHR